MARLAAVLSALVLVSACARGGTPPSADGPAPAAMPAPNAPVSPVTAQATATPFELTGQVLPRLIACGEPGFLALPRAAQRASLAADPRVQCTTTGEALDCAPTEPLSAFDLHVFDFHLASVGGGQELSVRLRGDDGALAAGVATTWPRPVRVSGDGRWRSLRPDASYAIHLQPGQAPGEVRYTCRLAAPGEDLFAGAPPAARGSASLSGSIEFPGEAIPALRVCAIDIADPARHRCVRTAAGTASYRLDGLAAGEYQVWAWLIAPEADIRMLRAMQDVQCIRAPCPRQPLTVTLAEGARVAQVTLNEAAAAFDDAPPAPADD